MKKKSNALLRITVLFKYLVISLGALTFSRMLLYLFNPSHFNTIDFLGFLIMVWKGLRFDLSVLAACMSPFVFFYFIPFSKKWVKTKNALLIIFFCLANVIFISFNAIDSIYFRFTSKRSTADFFSFVTTGGDTLRLVPYFLTDYWYIVVIAILMFFLSIKLYKSVNKPAVPESISIKYFFSNLSMLIIMAALAVLAIRGGVQLKPIRAIDAVEAAGLNHAPLVLNTPFTIMKSFNNQHLEKKHYFSSQELQNLYSPLIDFPAVPSGMRKKNVVIIIMESFSKEYMGPPFGLENKTPFLDSLAKESLFFNRAFANGKKSIEGLPAILAGIPSLMEDPYITSIYSNNNISALPSLLREKGYHTSFFHGGITGTMGFDAFCSLAGFQEYYGMEDFSGEYSFDGAWGIYDEPFFNFFGQKLEKMPEPFFASILSLSSHHPYSIPEQYKEKFNESPHPLLNTIAYSDMALQQFFEKAQGMPWYKNTLFVITADHTGQNFNTEYASPLGNFAVPLLFYAPSDSQLKGVSEEVAQHIDITAAILDYLQYEDPFFNFGTNTLSKNEKGFAINYLNNMYQFIQGDHVLYFDGKKSVGLYNYKNDITLSIPLNSADSIGVSMERKCKAVIQTYNNALINNHQTAKAYQ